MSRLETVLFAAAVVWGWILVYKLDFGNFMRKNLKIAETNKSFFVSDTFIKLIVNILATLLIIGLVFDFLR